MAKSRSTSPRRRGRKAKRTNPNSVYWRVGAQKPWRTSPEEVLQRERVLPARSVAGVVTLRTPVGHKPGKAKAKAKRAQRSVPVAVVRAVAPKKPAKRRRNPPAAAARDLFARWMQALTDLQRRPVGFAYLAGGAAATAVGGTLVAGGLARVLPATQSAMLARLLNAGTYGGTAALAALFIRDPIHRRQAMAGGLAVTLLELARPGAVGSRVARLPILRSLIGGGDPSVPTGVGDDMDLEDAPDEAVLVDGIRDDDGAVYGLADDGDGSADGDAAPPVGDDDDTDAPIGELVRTYLGDLGHCAGGAGRANRLTAVVTP